MKRIIILLLALMKSVAFQSCALASPFRELERGIALVKAEVVSIEKTPTTVIATSRILHVYSGSRNVDYVGKNFKATTFLVPTKILSLSRVLKRGDQGLWVVSENKEEKFLYPVLGETNYGLSNPIFKGDAASSSFLGDGEVLVSFDQAEELCSFIERVTTSEPEGAVAIIKESILSDNAAISFWSVGALANILNEKEAMSYLRQVEGVRRIITSISIDKELLRIDGENWKNSAQRRSVMEIWTADFLKNEYDTLYLVQYLREMQNVDAKDKIRIMQRLVKSKKFSVTAFRESVVFYAGLCRRDSKDSLAFKVIVEEMNTHEVLSDKISAAMALRLLNLSIEEVDVIRKMIAELTGKNDSALRRSLEIVLSRYHLDNTPRTERK